VTGKLPDVRALPLEDEIQFGPIRIQPIATPHQELEHYSYLVTWHGIRLYFTGDTERATELFRVKDLDVLFVTPWLAQRVLRVGRKLPAKKKVVYHHTAGERVSDCRDCLVPRQGESFELSY
jgi:L-ascorbate metabolism protein UlaG (beta-lactamase superfamily)